MEKTKLSSGVFQEVVQLCDLHDMGYTGHAFTWSNNRSGEPNVQERLDRFLANSAWLYIFSWHQVSHLPKRRSDHLPILLECRHSNTTGFNLGQRKKRPCRFEKAWTQVARCEELITEIWKESQSLPLGDKALHCCKSLKRKLNIGTSSIRKEVKRKKEDISKLQEDPQSAEVIDRIRSLNKEIDELELQKEMMWHQRSWQN